jgi:hypothetical protein
MRLNPGRRHRRSAALGGPAHLRGGVPKMRPFPPLASLRSSASPAEVAVVLAAVAPEDRALWATASASTTAGTPTRA